MISEIEILAGNQNLALGKRYSLRPPPTSTERYADTSDKLTDGVYATRASSQRRSVAWQEGNPSVVIDLQAPEEIVAVSAHVLGGGARGIQFPENVRVALSLDADNWQHVATVASRAPNSDRSAQAYLTAHFDARACRFVKLDFQRRGWLVVDEIEVLAAPSLPTAGLQR